MVREPLLAVGSADNERPDGSATGCVIEGTVEIAGGADAECEIPETPGCGGGDVGGVGGGIISARRDPISIHT